MRFNKLGVSKVLKLYIFRVATNLKLCKKCYKYVVHKILSIENIKIWDLLIICLVRFWESVDQKFFHTRNVIVLFRGENNIRALDPSY